MTYTLTEKEYRTLKSRLTRAQNSGDPRKVIHEARRAHAIFRDKGFPDDWSRWERALDDALIAEGTSGVPKANGKAKVVRVRDGSTYRYTCVGPKPPF